MFSVLMIIVLGLIPLLIWVYLVGFHGDFWRVAPQLGYPSPRQPNGAADQLPKIAIIVPTRNEANQIETVLQSLLAQEYRGDYSITLLDDNSSDGTGDIARKLAAYDNRLRILKGAPLPSGWSGKLWAQHQAIEFVISEASHSSADPTRQSNLPDYFWLSDADILHAPHVLAALVEKAQQQRSDLTSTMVRLSADEGWERLIIPAFVYFFQMLFPFQRVANDDDRVAGAAGGSILIKPSALSRIGGLSAIRDALIDDCTLAARVKQSGGRLWLGHGMDSRSVRPYAGLRSLWDMVARTAFSQLDYKLTRLMGTGLGMLLLYVAPFAAMAFGVIDDRFSSVEFQDGELLFGLGAATYFLMTISFLPTIRSFGQPAALALTMPAIAMLFLLMTVDSARLHLVGKGVRWHARDYKYTDE
ncbi:MAG: glycosyltransferase [Pseudomonadota bacterium]